MVIKAFSDTTKFGIKGGGKDKTGKQDTYATILSSFSYSSQTTAKQKRYRQLFIYGMAAHVIGDSFAHSTIAEKTPGKFYPIKHGTYDPKTKTWNVEYHGADDVTIVENRYKCAKVGVEETMWNAVDNISCGWIDYAIAVRKGEINVQLAKPVVVQTFYMANMIQHATANGISSILNGGHCSDIMMMSYTAST